MKKTPSRREFVVLGTAGMAAWVGGCADGELGPEDPVLDADCVPLEADGAPTNSDIEGPFYLAEAPERADLDTVGDEGIALVLEGVVTLEDGSVPADASVEIWHADPTGGYDNSATMNYRGRVSTDSEGTYRFTTLMPGRYLNGGVFRPSHIHLKVWVGSSEALTTQIYFQGDPYMEGDSWAEAERAVCLEDSGDGAPLFARFDIVLEGA